MFALVGVVSALPHLSRPIDRLVNVKSNGPQPSYVNLRNDAPLRKAARIIPDSRSTTYFLQANSTYALDLYGAAVLYFPPAVEVSEMRLAQWIVSYGVDPQIPATLRVVGRYRIDDSLTLVHVETA